MKDKDEILLLSIGENSYALTIAQLCEVLGFVSHDEIAFTTGESSYVTWIHFMNERVIPGISNESRITHPTVHYVHRLIA